MKDDYTTNSQYLTQIFLFKRLGECTCWNSALYNYTQIWCTLGRYYLSYHWETCLNLGRTSHARNWFSGTQTFSKPIWIQRLLHKTWSHCRFVHWCVVSNPIYNPAKSYILFIATTEYLITKLTRKTSLTMDLKTRHFNYAHIVRMFKTSRFSVLNKQNDRNSTLQPKGTWNDTLQNTPKSLCETLWCMNLNWTLHDLFLQLTGRNLQLLIN